jgi:hypothetical protein
VALATAVGQLTSEVPQANVASARKLIADRLARVGYHWEDQDGQQVQVPGLGVRPDDVQIERGADQRSARITVDYSRTVKLKPLDRYWTLQFHTTREGILRP